MASSRSTIFTLITLHPMPIDQSHPGDEAAMSGKPLHESELKYQRLVEGIGGDYVIYTHDPDGVITYVSPSIVSVLGFPVEAVLGLNWRDLIGEHFIGRDLADRVTAEVAAGKKFYNFTVEISHANGSTRLIEIQQRPLFDAAGQYRSMEGIAKDITEATRNAEELQRLQHELEQRVADRTAALIRSNERLRESEARYRTVVDCQTEFVIRWLPGAVFTFVNEAFCRLLGQTSHELIGWCFLPIVHPDDRTAFQDAIARLNQAHPYAALENRLLLPNGSVRWTHWTNQMLFDDDGLFLEFQSVGRDITELKHAADVIREKEAHLAHVSRLATMGELVAGMAHEVYQPLHAAKTFAEAARRNLEISIDNLAISSATHWATDNRKLASGELANGGIGSGEIGSGEIGSGEIVRPPLLSLETAIPTTAHIETAIDCTKEISKAISRTAKIIRQLREFTSSRPVKFERLNLNQVVREASELIVFETRKAQVKLNFELAANIPAIQGDQIQLEQACVNLLMNAYEAMVESPVAERQVIISTEADARQVRLSFRDFGSGIPAGNLDIVFDAFFSTKRQGMGMGLSLCKSIAEAHGGRIWGQRNETAGMTFELELPILKWRSREQSQEADRFSDE